MRRSVCMLLLALGLFAAVPAAAQPAPTLEGFRSANRNLALEAHPADDDGLPRLSDRTHGPLLRAAFDARVLQLVDWEDTALGMEICTLAGDLPTWYLLKDPIGYQDEWSLAMSFYLRCMGHAMPAAGRFWDALPASKRTQVRLDGLRQLREGVLEMYVGAVNLQNAPPIKPGNRDILLEALLEGNVGLGGLMTLEDRKTAAAAIGSVLSRAPPETRPQLTRLRDELLALPCTGPCLVS